MKRWFVTPAIGVALFAASAAIFVGSLWVITEFVEDKEVLLATAFVFGLAFLLAIIAGIVASFHALELTSPKSAFGLPEGSIRAIIALVLILIFVVMAIYLVEAVYLGTNPTPEAQNAATQILATVGTLVAAVAAFYFGSAAVTSGTKAATIAVEAAQAPARPAAITKGSKKLADGGYELVGIVNPRGRETQYFFEYGPESSYGNRTVAASAGAADAERHVTSDPLPLEERWHLRVVAFNDDGTSYGDDATVDPLPAQVESTSTSEPEDTAVSKPETPESDAQANGESNAETKEV
jgi:hypothetical protein